LHAGDQRGISDETAVPDSIKEPAIGDKVVKKLSSDAAALAQFAEIVVVALATGKT